MLRATNAGRVECMEHTRVKIIRTSSLLGAALLAGVALTGCSAMQDIKNSAADAWKVTYEVSVDSSEPSTLTEVSYLDQASRTEKRTTVPESSVQTTPRDTGDSAWETDSLVIVGDQTKLSATPAAGQRATCRILLDGEREIATNTGEPGEKVTCEATAPAFAK